MIRTISRGLAGVLAMFAVLAAAGAAHAQSPQPFQPADAVRLLQAEGFKAKLNPPEDKATGPSISSAAGGIEYDLYFERCETGGVSCGRLLIEAGFDFDDGKAPSITAINTWNSDKYGKAYLDKDGDPWLSIEINIASGLSDAAFRSYLSWWDDLIEQFTDAIDFN